VLRRVRSVMKARGMCAERSPDAISETCGKAGLPPHQTLWARPMKGGVVRRPAFPAPVTGRQAAAMRELQIEARELAPAQTNTTTDEKADEHGSPEVVGGEKSTMDRPTTPASPKSTQSTVSPETPIHKVTTEEDDEEEEERIQIAIPAEQLPDPGDAALFAIDTIDDGDDIRGLTCGHAFHASCVDPWLTSRRACCPLCKADYYVPKPRPDGVEVNATNVQPPPTAFSLIGSGRPGPKTSNDHPRQIYEHRLP